MPRGPRLDSPGSLHHVIARGIERGAIFTDDHDRDDFIERLSRLALDGALSVYARALMPNHFHLLVRTERRPLERSMRSLLSGYVTWFNRRHARAGHLLQNRYRSTLCEDDRYFAALVRYVHRNPLPAIVPDAAALASYPYTGHSALVGVRPREWQDIDEVLRRFAAHRPEAIRRYVEFVTGEQTERDLEGGGLRRSRGSWAQVHPVGEPRERFGSDERILGSPSFVARVLRRLPAQSSRNHPELSAVIERVCARVGVDARAVRGDGRSRDVSRARAGIAYLWTITFGRSARALAESLGLAESSVHEAARRGALKSTDWEGLLASEPPAERRKKPV